MKLSVVVTIVDGGTALERCLHALTEQDRPPAMEVLVPYDRSRDEVAILAERFGGVRFLAMGVVRTERPLRSAAGQHELFDRRRAAGLAAATGDVIAIVEDRGVPRSDWARSVVAAHRDPAAVIGGAVENGRPNLLNRAVYYCDFGRYQLPVPEGRAPYVTDVNVAYKRSALDSTAPLWRERYHETTVHWELERRGEELRLTPTMVVDQQRDGLTLGGLVRERFWWGRLFAWTRVRHVGRGRRWVYVVMTPLLPAVMMARLVTGRIVRRREVGRLLLAGPVVAILLIAWAAGEAVGYLTGRP